MSSFCVSVSGLSLGVEAFVVLSNFVAVFPSTIFQSNRNAVGGAEGDYGARNGFVWQSVIGSGSTE